MKKIVLILFLLNNFCLLAQVDSAKEQTAKRLEIILEIKNNYAPAAPLVVKENKIISFSSDIISCFNLDGNLIWEYNSSGTLTGKPALEGDLLAASTYEGDLLTINSNNGELTQVIGLGEPLTSNIEIIDIPYSGMKTKGIVVGSEEGKIYCYELYSLEQIWESQSTGNSIKNIKISGKNILINSENNFSFHDAATGSLIWRWPDHKQADSLFQNSFAVDNKNLFSASANGNLNAVDLLLGTVLWKKNYNLQEFFGADEKTLFGINDKNIFMIISKKDGSVIKRFKIEEYIRRINLTPLSWNSNYLLSSDNGNLYMIDPASEVSTIYHSPSGIGYFTHLEENKFILQNSDGSIIFFEIF